MIDEFGPVIGKPVLRLGSLERHVCTSLPLTAFKKRIAILDERPLARIYQLSPKARPTKKS